MHKIRLTPNIENEKGTVFIVTKERLTNLYQYQKFGGFLRYHIEELGEVPKVKEPDIEELASWLHEKIFYGLYDMSKRIAGVIL